MTITENNFAMGVPNDLCMPLITTLVKYYFLDTGF